MTRSVVHTLTRRLQSVRGGGRFIPAIVMHFSLFASQPVRETANARRRKGYSSEHRQDTPGRFVHKLTPDVPATPPRPTVAHLDLHPGKVGGCGGWAYQQPAIDRYGFLQGQLQPAPRAINHHAADRSHDAR